MLDNSSKQTILSNLSTDLGLGPSSAPYTAVPLVPGASLPEIPREFKRESLINKLESLISESGFFNRDEISRISQILRAPGNKTEPQVESLTALAGIASSKVIDAQAGREFAREVVLVLLKDSKSDNLGFLMQRTFDRSKSANVYELAPVVQLMVRHGISLDRNDLRSLLRAAEDSIDSHPLRLGKDLPAETATTEGCTINYPSLAGLDSASLKTAERIKEKFDPAVRTITVPPPYSAHLLSSLPAEQWKKRIEELRSQPQSSEIPVRRLGGDFDMRRAIELMLRLYEVSDCQVRIIKDSSSSLNCKWQVYL